MSLQAGDTLGPYRIVEQIGRGGMASVYKAYQPALARYVAIKVLPEFFAEEPSFRERFQQEAIAVAQLRHPNILVVFDYGEQHGSTYLVGEFVDGGTLAEKVGKPFSLEYVTQVLGPIASALDYAHGRGILHRDIKPSNILLNTDGSPVLSDFGLAKMIGSLPRLTMTGTTVGTPEYMAPEQGEGGEIGPSADNYAIAVVAYELLTGRVPYSAETPLAVLLAHLHRPLPMPRTVNPALPEAVEAVLLKGLAKSPADRYPTASEFVHALAEAGRPVKAPPLPVPAAATPPAFPALTERRDIRPVAAARRSWRPRRTQVIVGGIAVVVAALLPIVLLVALHANTSSTALPGAGFTVTPLRGIVAASATPGSSAATAPAAATATFAPQDTPLAAVTPAPAHWQRLTPPNGGFGQQVVALKDGRVLFVGGHDVTGVPTGLAEIYNPSTNTWAGAAPMRVARATFAAVLLADGRVLAVGGEMVTPPLTSAEIYDPNKNSWTPAQPMHAPRFYATTTVLANGDVLVSGGEDMKFAPLTTAEIYLVRAGIWKQIAAPALVEHTVTPMRCGCVLAVVYGTARTFNATDDTWTTKATPLVNRSDHIAVLLKDGRLLVAGGEDYTTSRLLASAELYDLKANAWKTTGSMHVARSRAAAVLLADGRVLVSGGEDTRSRPLSSAELYDPRTGRWQLLSNLPEPRSRDQALLLENGKVLLAGGLNATGALGDAVIYTPVPAR